MEVLRFLQILRYTIQRNAGTDVTQIHHVLQATRLNAFCSPLHQCHCGAEVLHRMDEMASVRMHGCEKRVFDKIAVRHSKTKMAFWCS